MINTINIINQTMNSVRPIKKDFSYQDELFEFLSINQDMRSAQELRTYLQVRGLSEIIELQNCTLEFKINNT